MSKFSFPAKEVPRADPPVDPAALQAFAAGARQHSTGQRPWDAHDPNALPKYNVSVRLNDYHLAMLRYLSEAQDLSQQKILRKLLLPSIERLAEQTFSASAPKSLDLTGPEPTGST